MSRRVMLLLESDYLRLSKESGAAWKRVVRAIISEYVDHDSGFNPRNPGKNVPRFLLNDVVRFWRTLCVDFAYKQWEQQGHKWGLRNIKLRMSRKLIFVKGLLMCMRHFQDEAVDSESLKGKLCAYAEAHPLPFIYDTLNPYTELHPHLVKLFAAYDTFLHRMNDKSLRDHLERLNRDTAYD
ncbi:MAG: hypothetical protein EOP09_19185, partial [Proteobacteria bacterium]